jgi:hypothetical protein
VEKIILGLGAENNEPTIKHAIKHCAVRRQRTEN